MRYLILGLLLLSCSKDEVNPYAQFINGNFSTGLTGWEHSSNLTPYYFAGLVEYNSAPEMTIGYLKQPIVIAKPKTLSITINDSVGVFNLIVNGKLMPQAFDKTTRSITVEPCSTITIEIKPTTHCIVMIDEIKLM
jgi:hypothetical protein